MRKNKKTRSIIFTLVIIILGCIFVHNYQMHTLFKKDSSTMFDIENDRLEEILDKADSFIIEKQIFDFKKHYYIIVDDVVVGEVTGRLLPIFGDKLEMKDREGNIVKSEYQVKRLGPTNGKLFNISIDRLAEIKDSNGNTAGYIGEEKLKDFWKLNRIQYFFDNEARKLGKGKQDFFILCKDYKVMDMKGNTEYIVDGNIFSISSKFEISKRLNNINEEDIIFYTIIENSIINSKISDSSSSSKSSK